MNLRSLRVRVGLAAALSILVALAVLGSTLVVLLGRQLHDELDRALRTRATEVAQLVATTPALVTQPGALEAPLGGQQLFVEVLDRHQRIVARSSALGAKVLSVPDAQRQALAGHSARTSVRLGETPLRVLAAPLPAGSGTAAGGVVLVAASTRSIDATIAEARRLLVLSALAAALVAGLVAAGLARRALQPLSRLSAGVREITRTSDPTRRLPEPATGDELSELAGTLNTMLGALAQARERERRFVADASHELRTPLTALRGNAEHIARHGADPEALAISPRGPSVSLDCSMTCSCSHGRTLRRRRRGRAWRSPRSPGALPAASRSSISRSGPTRRRAAIRTRSSGPCRTSSRTRACTGRPVAGSR